MNKEKVASLSLNRLFKSIISCLEYKDRRKFRWLLFMNFGLHLLDLFSLATVIPYVWLVLGKENLDKFPFLKTYLGESIFSPHFLWVGMLFIFFLFLLKNVLAVRIISYQEQFIQDYSLKLSRYVLEKLLYGSYRDKQEETSSAWAYRINQIPQLFSIKILQPFIHLSSEFMMMALVLGIFLVYNWVVVVVLVLIPGFLWWIGHFFIKQKVAEIGLNLHRLYPVVGFQVYQPIKLFIDVIGSGKQPFFIHRFLQYKKELNTNLKADKMWNYYPRVLIELILIVALFVITLAPVFDLITYEELAVFLSLFVLVAYRLLPTFKQSIHHWLSIKNSEHLLDAIVVNSPVENLAKKGKKDLVLSSPFELVLENIGYHYGKSAVLKGFSHRFESGKIVGIKGPSGCGKSTLSKIIGGLLPPEEGKLFYVEKGIQSHFVKDEFERWMKTVSYISLESSFLRGSIAENVAFGYGNQAIENKEENIKKALQEAAIWDWVKQQPQGMFSQLEEAAENISDGQKQRLLLARAFFKNPAVIILDEATNALDKATEKEILAVCRKKMEGKLILIISHHSSALSFCNEVIDMDYK